MGVLSFLGLLTMGGYLMGADAYARGSDEEERRAAKKRGELTYRDHKAKERYVENNELCMWTIEGDLELIKSQRVIRLYDRRLAQAQKELDDYREMIRGNCARRMIEITEEKKKILSLKLKSCGDEYKKSNANNEITETNFPCLRFRDMYKLSYITTGKEGGQAGAYVPNRHSERYLDTFLIGSAGQYIEGKELYDFKTEKYVEIFKYDPQKVENCVLLQTALRDVIDDMIPGKRYLMEIGDEVVTFPTGKYELDVVGIAKKGSLEELPNNPDLDPPKWWSRWLGWMNNVTGKVYPERQCGQPLIDRLMKVDNCSIWKTIDQISRFYHVERKDLH